MTNLKSFLKETNTKRRLASRGGCLCDLAEELPLFFNAYIEAFECYNREIISTPPESRCRGFEASLLNSKLIQAFQKYFPRDWKFGKYRRFILYKKGYLVLIKKLDSKGRPMNIKTKIVESINLQRMSSLFEERSCTEEPIVYFGYKKDKTGNIHEPQIVYIDENMIRWTITESDIVNIETIGLEKTVETVALPKLRVARKKAAND